MVHLSKPIYPFLLLVLFLLLSGCALLGTPPRLEMEREEAASEQEELFMPAPTPTGERLSLPQTEEHRTEPGINPILTVWVNETGLEHQLMLEEMTKVLDAEYGLHMEFVLVDENRLVDLVESAAEIGQLPDVIIHSVEYSAGWAERGILDSSLSHSILDSLGRDTFNPAVLDVGLVNEKNPAIPIDGYKQMLLYRSDWFEDLGLEPPTDYRSILRGAGTIYRSETLSAQNGITNTLLSGLVVPTESDLISTHHVFEHLARANNCSMIEESGEVVILSPACIDAFEFYRELINRNSPSDIQTDISAINAYLSGRTGMIFGSPSLLLELAGLGDDRMPNCPECESDPLYLTTNSGIEIGLSGRNRQRNPIEYSHVTLMGFTFGTEPDLAARFADYWFNAGYELWIGLEPARRVPMREGDVADGQKFMAQWYTFPVAPDGSTLTDIYGREITDQLASEISIDSRWGIAQNQGDLTATVFGKNVLSIVLQEMLSGYLTSSQAIVATWERLVELIPNYRFDTEIPNFIPSNDSG